MGSRLRRTKVWVASTKCLVEGSSMHCDKFCIAIFLSLMKDSCRAQFGQV